MKTETILRRNTGLIDLTAEAMMDRKSGVWLERMRNGKGLMPFEAAMATRISVDRLMELEAGEGKGITHAECACVAMGYGINPQEVLRRAAGMLDS